jgi:hypothetical protein
MTKNPETIAGRAGLNIPFPPNAEVAGSLNHIHILTFFQDLWAANRLTDARHAVFELPEESDRPLLVVEKSWGHSTASPSRINLLTHAIYEPRGSNAPHVAVSVTEPYVPPPPYRSSITTPEVKYHGERLREWGFGTSPWLATPGVTRSAEKLAAYKAEQAALLSPVVAAILAETIELLRA